tara:strand:- start:69583 stop:70755 length:1173 start_codon:yes stop_codon:yes gene_type:complete
MKLVFLISNRLSNSSLKESKISNFLSIAGMGVGCFALVISISVLNGFENLVKSKLKGFGGEIKITGEVNYSDYKRIKDIKGVLAAMPFIERRALIKKGKEFKVVTYKAVEIDKLNKVYSFDVIGSLNEDGILIGQDLASNMDLQIGDEIEVNSPIDQSFSLGIPRIKKLKISGIFTTKVLNYDEQYVFISLKMGESIFIRKKSIDGFDVKLNDYNIIKKWGNALFESIGQATTIQTWEDLNRSLVDAMKLERIGIIMILSLIFLIAAFNLASTLTLISMQKIRDTTILQILGAPAPLLNKILFFMGLKKGLKGAMWGLFIGVFVVLLQSVTKVIPIPSNVYFTDSLPMSINLFDLSIIILIAITFIILPSYISSRKVADFNPQQGMQWFK